MRIVFFDTETTGGGPEDRLIQLAVKERGVEKPLVNALYAPPVPISIESMVVHGITPKMVAGRPAFKDAPEYAALKELFESEDVVAVAHNAGFDVAMLAREGIEVRTPLDTLKVARALDEKGAIPVYSLQYLRYFLELEVEAEAHDAWGDVLVLEALFERLFGKVYSAKGGVLAEKVPAVGGVKSEDAAIEEMLRLTALPVMFTSFKFGKYKGRTVAEIAREAPDYLEWLLVQKRKDPLHEADWIYTLEYHLKAGRGK